MAEQELVEKYRELRRELAERTKKGCDWREYKRICDEQHRIRKELASRVQSAMEELKSVQEMQEDDCLHQATKDNYWGDILARVRYNLSKTNELELMINELPICIERLST